MHRLLSVRNIYRSGLHGGVPSSQNNLVSNAVLSEVKCSFCRKVLLGRPNIENLLLVRHQSTRAANALQKSSKKKTKYKNCKKYGEVLEVGDKKMTESKVSISKLNAQHLHKLASSTVSLGDLHQIASKPVKKPAMSQIDPDLLQKFRDKILNNPRSLSTNTDNVLEYDKCALVFTTQTVSTLEDKIKSQQFLQEIKDSYYNFRKATLYDQKLQDIHYAINEGINQEFDLTPEEFKDKHSESTLSKKGPHAVFKEIFFNSHLDRYDHEFMAHLSTLSSPSITHRNLDEFGYDEPGLQVEGIEAHELDIEEPTPSADAAKAKSLKVKKEAKSLKAQKKAKREKTRARQEEHMKEGLKAIEARGRQEAWHTMLMSHMELLCSLNMTKEGHQVLQFFRSKDKKAGDKIQVVDVNIYNKLLHGFAAAREYTQAEELFVQMEQDGIKPNAQTFAATFEAIERSHVIDKMNLLNIYFEKMQNMDITFNDLIDKSTFTRDQQETVLRAIRRLEPAFVPIYTPPELDYTCPLLEDLKLDKVENRLGLNISPAEGLLTLEELKSKVQKQLKTEIAGEIEIENIDYKDNPSETVLSYREKLKECEGEWRKVIEKAFVRDLASLKSRSSASHAAVSLYPYLTVLPVNEFVELVMNEINNLRDGSESFSPTLKYLHRNLGTHLYHKYQIIEYKRTGVLAKLERILDEYSEWYLTRRTDDGMPYNSRQVWQKLMHKHRDGPSLDVKETQWPLEIRQNIGKFLYNIIINDVKINVNMFKNKASPKYLPAVYKVHRPWGRIFRLEIKPHPTLMRLFRIASPPTLKMKATLAPMYCVTAPWRKMHAKPYLLTDTPLIRMPTNVVQQWQRLEEAPAPSLYPSLDSLNQLGEVPWHINKPILDLQLQIFRSGGNKSLDIPPPPSSLDTRQWDKNTGAAGAFRRRLAIARAKAEMYSLWCDALYKLSLANHYRDELFWLPHNMDFRGRVYACPPHLSQLGADTARALLKFAKPKPLGKDGLKWLKLHCINLTGTMKHSTIDERMAYAESILPQILESADRPLDGEAWWMKSEEPWQTLAACKEIANAVRAPCAEEYQCGFPIQQDGSCNGLQHYAALGADSQGAMAVNLAPSDSPRDLYATLAEKVEEMRVRDAAKGVLQAQVLEGFVRRKVIKQTVMTTVYGVTRFGARLQIAKQLKDIDEFPKDQVWGCSQYLTAKTFDCLREMFTSAKLIQDWFTDCAKVISSVCGSSVEWVTPLGLPVVQPYFKRANPSSLQCNAPLDHQQRPCTMKQRNAFPPNFIHSLDSSHMMLTSLRCQASPDAVTFVSVHDCFWTHAQTVEQMNKITREQFVALHSQPILDDLSEFLMKRFAYEDRELQERTYGAAMKKRVNSLLTQVPAKGDFDLQNVIKSVYFFS